MENVENIFLSSNPLFSERATVVKNMDLYMYSKKKKTLNRWQTQFLNCLNI